MKYQIVSERTKQYKTPIIGSRDAYELLRRYAHSKQETYLTINLDSQHVPISVNIITIGILNKTMVHPREIFRKAIAESAESIITAHNHPSGNLDPSPEDKEIADTIQKAGEILHIPVLDQLIISQDGFTSQYDKSV